MAVLLVGVMTGFFLRDWFSEKPVAAKVVTLKSRNLEFQVETRAKTIGEVLMEQGFSNSIIPDIDPGSSLDSRFRGNDNLPHGLTINLRKPVNVVINDGGNEKSVTTTAETIGDLLAEQKIALALTDRVSPGLENYLGEGTQITIDRIVDLEVTEVNEIPFEIKLEYDPELFYGREVLVSAGSPGQKEQKFLITYKNGAETKRKLLSQKVLQKPVAEIRKFGIKIEIEETAEGRASWYATKACLSAFGGCAAHPYYELGRYVRVTSLASGKSIIVKINDRGPDLTVHPDRVIDLDVTAYRALADPSSGTIPVTIELLKN